MTDFSVRSDSVNVEQLMERIRARIREKRGVDYTEQQIKELASVKLEKFLDPNLVRSDLVEHYRGRRPGGSIPPRPQTPPPLHPPIYAFDEETIYASSRGFAGKLIRLVRRILNPVLKLFFNPTPLVHVLHLQAAINAHHAQHYPPEVLHHELGYMRDRFRFRDDLDELNFEVLNNIVVEITRLSIEVRNVRMRVESFGGRLDFCERRMRALESVVQYKPESVPSETGAAQAAPEGPSAEGSGRARRRRRRGRARRGPGPAASTPSETSVATDSDLESSARPGPEASAESASGPGDGTDAADQ
jgi:hypothetical protein